jgi:bifunctional DNA-binding transcriptional regulator/antitoxin component of YhaV-PrlF toxin-antitoxin module
MDSNVDVETQVIQEEGISPVIHSKETGQYSVKIPAKVARLLGLKKGTGLHFKASKRGRDCALIVEVKEKWQSRRAGKAIRKGTR